MQELLDDESLPADAAGLESEIQEVERRMEACRQDIRNLMDDEIASEANHAVSIHENKQRLMMLRYQKDLRVARKNRLHAGL